MTDIDLHPGDDALLRALLRGDSHAEAAASCGLSDRTVRRRMADASFRQTLRTARRETLRRTSDVLAEAAVEAVRTLADLMRAAESPASVRRASARDLLDFSLRVREHVDLTERVEELEQMLTGSGS